MRASIDSNPIKLEFRRIEVPSIALPSLPQPRLSQSLASPSKHPFYSDSLDSVLPEKTHQPDDPANHPNLNPNPHQSPTQKRRPTLAERRFVLIARRHQSFIATTFLSFSTPRSNSSSLITKGGNKRTRSLAVKTTKPSLRALALMSADF